MRHRAVRRFLWSSLVALLLCAGGLSFAIHSAARNIAIQDASRRGAALARYVIAPLVDDSVVRGDPEGGRILDTVAANRLRDDTMVRIKVWAPDGRVIWSDDHALQGQTFALEPEEAALFGTDAVAATVSDLGRNENVHEQAFAELIEVYAGAVDASGRPIVVESYWNSDRIRHDDIVIWSRSLPLALGALALFMLAVVPLALSLARRVDSAEAERSALLRHALAASEVERRKISRELHDGLIQDLTSLGYALPGVAAELPPGSTSAKLLLESMSDRLRDDIDSLRGILTDLYPVALARTGLRVAVEQLAAPLRAQGIAVLVEMDEGLEAISAEAMQFAYQVVREGTRNVVKHGHDPTTVRLRGVLEGSEIVVSVDDDGADPTFAEAREGHLGIRMLEDDVADIGGRVTLGPSELGGASLTASFPQMFVWSWAR